MGECLISSGMFVSCDDLRRVGGTNKRFWIFDINKVNTAVGQHGFTIVDGYVTAINWVFGGGLLRFEGQRKSHSGEWVEVDAGAGNIYFKHSVINKLLNTTPADDGVIKEFLDLNVGVILENNNKEFKMYGGWNGLIMEEGIQNTGQKSESDESSTLTFVGKELEIPKTILDTDYATTLTLLESYEPNRLIEGILSYWKFDELAGNAIDSADGNDGTVVGATQGAVGKIGTAYDFNGVNDWVNIDPILGDISLDEIGSVAAWIKPVNFGGASKAIFSVGVIGSPRMITFFADGARRLGAQYFNAANIWIVDTDNVVLNDGVWAHVALVQDGVSPVLYVDGVVVPQAFGAEINKTLWMNGVVWTAARIGVRRWTGNDLKFDGIIDEIGYWQRALSDVDILQLYNSGVGLSYPF